jgi:hypothetical protein
MNVRTRGTAFAAAGLAAASLLVPLATSAHASTTRYDGTRATSATKTQVVVAHITASRIRLSDDTVHAGRIMFRAVTKDRTHLLQVARLRPGYTVQQAGADINKAFQGDVAAVNRVDDGVSFRGGVETHPSHPGRYSTVLTAGHYVVLDQDGGGLALLTVTGSHVRRAAAPHQGTVTAFTYGFANSPRTLPATGWVRLVNQADQPHFVEFQRVKPGTTARMVRKSMSTDPQGRPSWGLRLNVGTGVISPGTSQVVHMDLPAGHYLLMCFWPDNKTGMAHAVMGMWKLVTVG